LVYGVSLALQRSFHRTLDLLRNSVVAYESLASGPLGSTAEVQPIFRTTDRVRPSRYRSPDLMQFA
jgi:hypothetical protein